MGKKTYKNFKDSLSIIKEYSELIPDLTKEKFAQLKDNIKQDKEIFDPLIIDKNNTILDGHNRYKIAEMLDMVFKTVVKEIDTIEDGIIWIVRHQIGRRDVTKDQLAAMGIMLIPHYRKMMKERQSKGGKGKEKMGGNLKTSQLVAKEVRINENLMKTVISLNNDIPEIIPKIRNGELLANEGKHLRNVCAKGAIVVDGKFTRDALTKLKAFRNPVLTKDEKEAQELSKLLAEKNKKIAADKKKKEKDDKDAKEKAEKEAREKLAKEQAEKEAQDESDKIQGDDPDHVSGTDGGGGNIIPGKDDVIKGNIEGFSEDQERKISTFLSRIDANITNENEGKIFTEKSAFIDASKESKKISEHFVNKYISHKKANTDSGYPENVIMAVPNNKLYKTWNVKATATSGMFCDSKKLPIRLLYFGSEDDTFIEYFNQFGNVSTVSKPMPNVSDFSESLTKGKLSNIKETFSPDNKAEIETLTPPNTKTNSV